MRSFIRSYRKVQDLYLTCQYTPFNEVDQAKFQLGQSRQSLKVRQG